MTDEAENHELKNTKDQKDVVKNVRSFSMSLRLASFVQSVLEKNLNPNDPISKFSFTYGTLR